MDITKEISEVLESFIKVREQALEVQKAALTTYHQEVNTIDHKLSDRIRRNQSYVEHNLLRHLGNSHRYNVDKGDEGGMMHADDYAEYSDESFVSDGSQQKQTEILLPEELHSLIETSERKMDPPSFEVKLKLRESVLEYMDSSRERENEMECLIDKMRQDDADFQKVEEALETLYRLRITNAETLRKSIIGYRPVQGLKAWSNDPEYETLLKLFEEVVISKPRKKKSSSKKKKAITKKKKMTRVNENV